MRYFLVKSFTCLNIEHTYSKAPVSIRELNNKVTIRKKLSFFVQNYPVEIQSNWLFLGDVLSGLVSLK